MIAILLIALKLALFRGMASKLKNGIFWKKNDA